MPTFTFGTQVCGSLAEGGHREWLVPDGRGGYAMGTVSGLRTRCYHGLMVVSGTTAAHRMMALAALDPVLTLPGGGTIRLYTHEWASGAVEPRGHTLLESFQLRDAVPTWRWRVGEVVLERTLAMRPGHPCLAVLHTLRAGPPVRLAVEPLCTWRDAHGQRRASDGLWVATTADGFTVEDAYRVAGPGFEPGGEWYLGAYHRQEAERGLAATEDLFRAGRFTADLAAGESHAVRAWAGCPDDLATEPAPAREIIDLARDRGRALAAGGADDVERALRLAADAFVVTAPGGPDVVAGYPWFGAWSRDTMISYAGLFLATGRVEQGRALLAGYAATLSEGMLANTADTGQTEYNTADATLWLVHAVERHVAATGDTDLAAELMRPLEEVIRRHRTGTRYGIRVDSDGLLTQGADGYALTWMDAVIHGVPVTPRRGKAVELNALWINALGALAALRQRLGGEHGGHGGLDSVRAAAEAAFRRRFPAPTGWLHDLLDGPDGDDAALRPNQLLAYGLPYAPLRGGDPAPVRAATRTLLTPLGLRSLDPSDPAYRGRHRGDQAGRDRAYHQGTVWPWLIGPYADAARAVGLFAGEDLLAGLEAHLGEWGVGSVSETADGQAPHAAAGCPFQAWSVAEMLRVYQQCRDDRQARPRQDAGTGS